MSNRKRLVSMRNLATCAIVAASLVALGCDDKGKSDGAKTTGAAKSAAPAKTGTKAAGGDKKKLHQWGPNCKAFFEAYEKACPEGTKEGKCRSWKFTVDDLKKRPEGHKDNAMAESKGCNMLKGQVDAFLKTKDKK